MLRKKGFPKRRWYMRPTNSNQRFPPRGHRNLYARSLQDSPTYIRLSSPSKCWIRREKTAQPSARATIPGVTPRAEERPRSRRLGSWLIFDVRQNAEFSTASFFTKAGSESAIG